MTILSSFAAKRRFYKLGWHTAQEKTSYQDAECLAQNRDAFISEMKAIVKPIHRDRPESNASAGDWFIQMDNQIKARRLEIKQLFHEHSQCLFLGARKTSTYALIFLLILAETLMIRPTLRDLFSHMGAIDSFSYLTAVTIGLSVMIHIAGTSLRSRRFALATVSLFIITATNALLIVARSMAIDSTWLFTSLFACVALLVTVSGIYLTYRLAYDESRTGHAAIDFSLLSHEYSNEGQIARELRNRFRQHQSLERAFFCGYHTKKISEIATRIFL